MFSALGFITKTSLVFLVFPWMQHVPPTPNKNRQSVKSTNWSQSQSLWLKLHVVLKFSNIRITCAGNPTKYWKKFNAWEVINWNTPKNIIHESWWSSYELSRPSTTNLIHSSASSFLLWPDILHGTVLSNTHNTHHSLRLKQDCSRNWVETLH
jgi:hypothetical protein